MGENRRSELDDLDVTKEELYSIGEALKSEQFRKLLAEYVDEVNDPENRARYEREVEQYERERGTDVTFVRPRPGYVVKTSADGVRKVFVNVCACDTVGRPVDQPDTDGRRWSLPHCLSPVRRDYDRAGKPCDVYDAVFHPDVFDLIKRDARLKNMVEDTALTVIEKNNGVTLDRANLKYPKMSFKGVARSLAIRKRIEGFQPADDDQQHKTDLPGCPYKPLVDRPIQHHYLGPLKPNPLYTVPKYIIKYRSDIDIQEHAYNMLCKMNAVIPKELIVDIHLPLLDSSDNVKLDVQPKSLKLLCHKPSKYKLDISLPYTVLDDQGTAMFDLSTKKLIVRLPVFRKDPSLKYVVSDHLVNEIETIKDEKCENNANDHQESNTVDDSKVIVTTDRQDENTNDDTMCNDVTKNDVHYTLPEHELIFGSNNCILVLNVKNVDPTSINVIVISDKNLISGKFHSIGSGFFPIWFSFSIQIPSKSSLLKSDFKAIPSDENLILEFSVHFKPNCKQYWYGLDQDNLTIQHIKTDVLKENSNPLADGIPNILNNSNDDDDDDVFDENIRETESNGEKQQTTKKNGNNFQCKDKNGKITKEKGKRKKGKKIQKSNAIPIVAGSLPESEKKIDFIPGSLPIEFNNIRPVIRGILKKRSLSESSNIDETILFSRTYSSSVDNVDTESSDVLESSLNDFNYKKTVRFNDHVIEKKINFSLSIAAQAKKHRQRQQRKRNIKEYNTPSESEASETEDRVYGGHLNMVSESEETSVSESSAGEMSDDNSNEQTNISSKITVVADSKKDHKRRKSKSARKNASLAKQSSTNSLIFPIEY